MGPWLGVPASRHSIRGLPQHRNLTPRLARRLCIRRVCRNGGIRYGFHGDLYRRHRRLSLAGGRLGEDGVNPSMGPWLGVHASQHFAKPPPRQRQPDSRAQRSNRRPAAGLQSPDERVCHPVQKLYLLIRKENRTGEQRLSESGEIRCDRRVRLGIFRSAPGRNRRIYAQAAEEGFLFRLECRYVQ